MCGTPFAVRRISTCLDNVVHDGAGVSPPPRTHAVAANSTTLLHFATDARTLLQFVPDARIFRLLEQQSADDERDRRDGNREPQSRIAVPRRCDDRRRDYRREPAEPAVPEVIRQRQRGIADLRWEGFDQERR